MGTLLDLARKAEAKPVTSDLDGRRDPAVQRDAVNHDEGGHVLPPQAPAVSSIPARAAVVRLRLVEQAEDGRQREAVLAVPCSRYDGLAVLEAFEKHRRAGTTRIVEISEIKEKET